MDSEREKLIQENLLKLKYKVQEDRLEKTWLKFAENGFHPILIKGWAAALKYPKPEERLYVDVDLIFDDKEFERASEFVAGNSFDLSIDLHRGARHLDSLSFEQLWANSTTMSCGQAQIRILCEEDHLRVLCVHWLNDGGAYKERLWDIYHAVTNRKTDFDWGKCLDSVNEKRRFWVLTAIGLTNHYFKMPIDDLAFKKELERIPKWVFRTVEKEWADEVKLMPLQNYFHDKKLLWKQIKKRFPPNALTATILVNGAFDNTPRIFYQAINMFQRIFPSLDRMRKRF